MRLRGSSRSHPWWLVLLLTLTAVLAAACTGAESGSAVPASSASQHSRPSGDFQIRPVVRRHAPATSAASSDPSPAASAPVTLRDPEDTWTELGPVLLDGSAVTAAATVPPASGGGRNVRLQLTAGSVTTLVAAAADAEQNLLAVVVDGRLVSLLSMRAQPSGGAIELGPFSADRARQLVAAAGG